MSRIREDFRGVVSATGMMRAVTLRAGDEIPADVAVDGALTDDGLPTRPERPDSLPLGPAGPLTDDEVHLALMHDVTLDRGPDYVRGFLDGVNWAGAHEARVPALPDALPDAQPAAAAGEDAQDEPRRSGRRAARPGEGGPAFDPTEHNAHDVIARMTTHPDEREAILAAERAGKNRASIVNRYASPAPSHAAQSA